MFFFYVLQRLKFNFANEPPVLYSAGARSARGLTESTDREAIFQAHNYGLCLSNMSGCGVSRSLSLSLWDLCIASAIGRPGNCNNFNWAIRVCLVMYGLCLCRMRLTLYEQWFMSVLR